MEGFTLVETMVAIGFFSLLSLAIFSTITSANAILRMQTLNAGINQGGMQLLRSLAREIAESSPVADQSHLSVTSDPNPNPDYPPYSNVRFQVPIDLDGDGDLVDTADPTEALTQLVKWGAYRFVRTPQAQSWLNGWVRYRVVNGQLLREILESSNGAILATDIIVLEDALEFNITQVSTNRYGIVLTIGKQDTIGQKGPTARTYQTTFDGDVMLRNGG